MSEKTEYILHGFEEIAREASVIGNGAHALVPRKWAGCALKIIRIDELPDK